MPRRYGDLRRHAIQFGNARQTRVVAYEFRPHLILCARVLHGKYLPNCDFMSASKKKNASHTWRAILAGRKVLEMGCIKRIGDGSTTNIWRDRWLPGGVGMKPICHKEGAVVELVSELLSPDGRSWDDDALDQNLVPLDAAVVR